MASLPDKVEMQLSVAGAPTPGYRTSEFWLTLGIHFLTTLIISGVLPSGSKWETVAMIFLSTLTQTSYTQSRGTLKKAAMELLASGSRSGGSGDGSDLSDWQKAHGLDNLPLTKSKVQEIGGPIVERVEPIPAPDKVERPAESPMKPWSMPTLRQLLDVKIPVTNGTLLTGALLFAFVFMTGCANPNVQPGGATTQPIVTTQPAPAIDGEQAMAFLSVGYETVHTALSIAHDLNQIGDKDFTRIEQDYVAGLAVINAMKAQYARTLTREQLTDAIRQVAIVTRRMRTGN